jgi:hypothetical protein
MRRRAAPRDARFYDLLTATASNIAAALVSWPASVALG